jgi:hypothetical protein
MLPFFSSADAAITFYRVGKRIAYDQTSDAQPAAPAGFDAGMDMYTDQPSDLTTARVFSTSPTLLSPASPFLLTEFTAGGWGIGTFYPSIEAMDVVIPPGDTFGFLIEGGDLGARLGLVELPPVNLFAPDVPYFTNSAHTQLNGMDPSQPFNFTWNSFDPHPDVNSSPIFFNIYRLSDGQSAFGTSFDPSVTAHVLPASTLAPATAYRAEIYFSSRVDTMDAGLISADSSVTFDVVTRLDFTTGAAAGFGPAIAPEPASWPMVMFGLLAATLYLRPRRRRGAISLLLSVMVIASAAPAGAAISFYRVDKGIGYQQTSAAQPAVPSNFSGGVDLATTTPEDLTSARVFSTTTMPPSPVPEFVLTEYAPGSWAYSQGFPSLAEMDVALPPGDTFGFLIEGGNLGSQLALLPVPPVNLFSPDIPFYTGDTYDRLNDFDTTAPFLFTWNGYTPAAGVTDAPIFFSIFRVSDGQSVAGTVVGNTVTSHVLPPNTLAPDTQYRATLNYSSRKVTLDAGFLEADATALYDVVTDVIFTTEPFLAGDYNRDGTVNAADYTVWRNTLGQMNVSPYSGADGDGDGDILPPDFAVWKDHYGESSMGAGAVAAASTPLVPEPNSFLLVFGGLVGAAPSRRTRTPPLRR